MGASLRTLRTLVLLCGFYLLSFVLLALLGLMDWAAHSWLPAYIGGKIIIGSIVLAVPIVRGVFMLRTPKAGPEPGVLATEEHEPALWQVVRETAAQVGTRAPDEIVLTDEVNASVAEDSRLLGLLPGTRRLHLGLPLMTGLDEFQLRSVLAHEMGHYANFDTRLTPLLRRGHVQLTRTIEHFHDRADAKEAKERARQEKRAAKRVAKGKKAKEVDTEGEGFSYRIMASVYTAYAKLYLRAGLAGSRRQELAADLAAVRVAGRDATASALRELNALGPAYRFYLNAYATLGVGAGVLPPAGQFIGGFRPFLDARSAGLDERRTELSTEPTSPYDSHPALAERVARVEALPDDGLGGRAARPALALLADADAVAVALEPVTLTPQALELARVDWEDLVHASMIYFTGSEARRAREAVAAEGVEPTPAGLLDALDRDPGLRARLTERLPRSEGARTATGRAAREYARAAQRRVLEVLVKADLTAEGTARWQLSWSEDTSLRYPGDGFEERLEAALDAAVADSPDTEPLRKLVLAP
ncbi:M48 family metallopeptidase [Streptomyces sp. NPDC048606]|uniref:M48 family metallopeptidase n=1 Tax=Streptomyces sp. NPDC048606 TaxID=3154726 RepID=UPI0034182C9F